MNRSFWFLTTGVPIKTGEHLPPADESTRKFMNWIGVFAIATPIVAILILVVFVIID